MNWLDTDVTVLHNCDRENSNNMCVFVQFKRYHWLTDTQFYYEVALYNSSAYKVKRKSKHATSLSISLENIPWKNNKAILSGEGGKEVSLPSKNNLHISYLFP